MSDRRKALSKQLRLDVYNKFGGHCAYCGRPISMSELQVDHVKSFIQGGSDDISNLLPSCQLCNRCKEGSSIDLFRKYVESDAPRIHFGRKKPIEADADRICEAYGLHPGKNDVKFYFEIIKK